MEIKNLNINFGGKEIFKDFSVSFEEGKITCILGASGIGKTTLLNAIAGLIQYDGEILKGARKNKINQENGMKKEENIKEKDSGRKEIEKEDKDFLKDENLEDKNILSGEKNGAAEDVSFVFQEDRLIPTLSVEKNLELVIRSKVKDKKERNRIVAEILEAVGLKGEEKSIKSELSGGMAQRVSMARAFIYPSKILLLDEPFKGLDPALKDKLIQILLSLYEKDKKTVVFVTHAIDEALLLSDRILVFDENPCKVIFDEKMESEKKSRTLSDEGVDKMRKKLLECRK